MCVKHAPRLNQGPLSCGPLFPMFFGRHLSIPCCSISSEDVQIDRTFSLLLETASGFELEPIPRSALYVERRATTERSAISRIVAKVLRPDCGGGGTGWTGGALMPRHGGGRSGRAPSDSAATSLTREGPEFASCGTVLPPARRGSAGASRAASATAARTVACASSGGSGRLAPRSMY